MMNKKGFTLVELMVVLAILGLLAGIGIPQYTKVMERAKIGADIARVAQVQAAVNAFIAECGSAEEVTEIKAITSPATHATFADLNGTSIITKAAIKLSDNFLDPGMTLDAVRGAMESKVGKSATGWYIDTKGRVSIGTAVATPNVLK